jgi:transposase
VTFAPPNDGTNRWSCSKFAEDVEQLLIHLVSEGVALLLVVVRNDGNRAIDLESDLSSHDSPCRRALPRSLAERADSVERVAKAECLGHTW